MQKPSPPSAPICVPPVIAELACKVAVASLQVLQEENLAGKSVELGTYFRKK